MKLVKGTVVRIASHYNENGDYVPERKVTVWNHMNDMNVICIDEHDAYNVPLMDLIIPKKKQFNG